jgi:hypothetical protein
MFSRLHDWSIRRKRHVLHATTRNSKKEAKALLMYAFTNEVIESIKIPELKQRITKIIANKLGVNLGFDL